MFFCYNFAMKKFYLLLACFLTVAFTGSLRAQTPNTHNAFYDPEKIYLFDVDIEVLNSGQIIVTENITLNAKHQRINRGIYRDLPVSLTEQTKPISLTMDGKTHPFFTERKNKYLRVNFGDDDYISTGVHTYRFVYSYTGAINFLKNYDELYWNATGNGWDFQIDTARAHVTFPSNVDVQKNGISLYTGKFYEKQKNAQEIAPLTFQTTKPLAPQEGLTIAIPFAKGAVQRPSLAQRLEGVFSLPLILSLVLLIILLGYFLFTWLKVGRDPSYMAITQYEPPAGISPAFMYYLEHEIVDSKLLTSAILDMAMKGNLQIQEEKGFFSSTNKLILKNPNTDGLPFEEACVRRRLFPFSDTCVLGSGAQQEFQYLSKDIRQRFQQEIKEYILSNAKYLTWAIVLTLSLGVLPFAILKNPPLIFINLHFSVFFLAFTLALSRFLPKIIFGLIFTVFYGVFWLGSGALANVDVLLCQAAYLIAMWSLTFYGTLIRNVTPLGRDVLEQIAGFKKYMKTAEVHRVAASDPSAAERIFCAYLPFAFALGMSNQWMRKFASILPQETIDRSLAKVGGAAAVAHGLASSVGSSMPSSSGGSGSHGGGCSGGGHGGGGGGGR